jgi:hypothetical protein
MCVVLKWGAHAFLCYHYNGRMTYIGFRLTTYNVIMVLFILLTQSQKQPWVDIIRATSLLIGTTVLIIIITTPSSAIIEFYQRTLPIIPPNLLVIHAHNFVIHFLPPLLLQAPTDPTYTLLGYAIFYTYYAVIRKLDKIQDMYVDNVSTVVYDRTVLAGGVLTALITLITV